MAPLTQSNDDTPTLEAFGKEWIAAYNDSSLDCVIEDNVWEAFSDNFVDFTKDEFNKLHPNRNQGLKGLLCKTSVFLQDHAKASKMTFGAALYQCAQRQEPHQWTDEDLHRYSTIVGISKTWLKEKIRTLRQKCRLDRSPILSSTRAHSPVQVHTLIQAHSPIQAHSSSQTPESKQPARLFKGDCVTREDLFR